MKNQYIYPAEWEKQNATWLAFPHNKKNWSGKRGEDIRKFYIKLIQTIYQFQSVHLLIPQKNFFSHKEECALNFGFHRVFSHIIKTDDIWIRDYGPFFLKKNEKTVIAQTEFNAWGQKFPPWKNDNSVPQFIADAMNYKIVKNIPYIFEGGAIEVNGDGLGMTTLDCLIGNHRNEPKNLSKIIKALCEVFGLKSLLILPHGLIGDHTDGHIDNVARFVAKDRVVIACDKKKNSKNALVLTEAKKLIEEFLKIHYGKKAKVDSLPLPPQRKLPDGQILPASYMNFIFVNGGLIFPKYKCKNDVVAKKYFEKIFPKRKVIGLDCRTLIEEGGSLHCISKQET